jgi:hypothetical protein
MKASSESGECASLISCAFVVACWAGIVRDSLSKIRSRLPHHGF